MSVNAVCNHNVAMVDAKTGVVEAAARMRMEHVPSSTSVISPRSRISEAV